MKTMNEGGDTARDEARPSAEHLARYARSYRLTTDEPVRFFWLWQEAMAHALLLEQQVDECLPEHGGMTALQLAEGARATARFFPFMLAEAPARDEAASGWFEELAALGWGAQVALTGGSVGLSVGFPAVKGGPAQPENTRYAATVRVSQESRRIL